MATRDFSSRQEKEIAKFLGGRVTPNSGGTRFGAGDVLVNDFLIEAKTVTSVKTSVSVKKEWIDKSQEQAFQIGKSHSAVAIRFEPDGEDYFIIDKNLFKELVQSHE